MKLSELLKSEYVVVPLRAADVPQGVVELVERLTGAGALASPEALRRKLAETVVEGTPVAEGIVLVHLRTEAARELVPAMGVWSEPVPFAARVREGEARVLVVLLAPARAGASQLPFVAALSRVLRDARVAERLRSARSAQDVLGIAELANLGVPAALTVKDAMTREVFRIFPDTSLPEIADLMIRHRLDALPVVGEEHEVLGIVTSRDLLRHVVPRGIAAEVEGPAPAAGAMALLARDLMTRAVLCVSEDQSLIEVANVMLTKNVDELPVVHGGVLTGSITRGDVLRKLFGR